ncbi:hypothetical protein QOZ96_002030 [Brevundimonas nasdae]|uniref:antitoxin n=1 Tax=Brevundimonas nasdae TaxID=172043 RepID=UPI001912D6B8|nr:antitoxin [Brevundimonas nasdae]MBK6025449.1 antitoxin [Brevundimonas nasdae]MDQ0452080.1 hypothetical protein [Brevundimonas nasdae]
MTKPQFLDGYSEQVTTDCERVLVTLLRGLGPLRQSVFLVGGLTPRYLVKAKPPEIPPHAGTGDIDMVVDMAILANTEAYATLEKNLKRMGFERGENDNGAKVNWRWKAKLESGSVLVVEFLAYDPNVAGRMVELPTAGNVTAMNIPHADIVFDLHDKITITAELLGDDGHATETIAHANRVSFSCLKAFAFDDRRERKDAHDLVYCLEHGEGGVEVAVAEFQAAAEGAHRDVIADGLRKLQTRFGDGENVEGFRKDGPVAVAKFEIGDDDETAELRLLRQRQVADIVGKLLVGLEYIWTEPKLAATSEKAH